MKNFRTGFLLSAILLSACGSFAQTRTEKDLLGDKQIPNDAYYGVQTARALENFQVSSMKTNFFPETWAAIRAEGVPAAGGRESRASLWVSLACASGSGRYP